MGLFSGLTKQKSGIETQLEKEYVQIFKNVMGMSSSQAQKNFNELLQQAKKESRDEGSINIPDNFGDVLLEKEGGDKKVQNMLDKKRKEGVKDEDVKWWWNIHDLERRMMLKVDEMNRIAMFTKHREEGLSDDEAAKRVKKYHPMYGELDGKGGNDSPLPFELKDRVNIYIQKRMSSNAEKYKKDIETSSSLNAFIRKEIKKGNI